MTTKKAANRLLVAVAAVMCAFASAAAEKVEVSSSDGAIRFAINVDGRLGYEVSYRGAPLVERSAIWSCGCARSRATAAGWTSR